MREIIASRLWLGNANDVRDLRTVHDRNIAAIVDLAFELSPPEITRDLIYCRTPIVDGSGNSTAILRTAIETVAALIRGEVPTLVACGAGMSRSPAIVSAALAVVRRQTLDEMLISVVADGPHDVSPSLWNDIKDTCASCLETD